MRWISDTLSKALHLAPSSLCVEIRVNVTGPSRASGQISDGDSVQSSSENSKEKDSCPASVLGLSCVKLAEGRADIKAWLQEEVGSTTGRMFVGGT